MPLRPSGRQQQSHCVLPCVPGERPAPSARRTRMPLARPSRAQRAPRPPHPPHPRRTGRSRSWAARRSDRTPPSRSVPSVHAAGRLVPKREHGLKVGHRRDAAPRARDAARRRRRRRLGRVAPRHDRASRPGPQPDRGSSPRYPRFPPRRVGRVPARGSSAPAPAKACRSRPRPEDGQASSAGRCPLVRARSITDARVCVCLCGVCGVLR